ncbi:MAG: AAC(3) family N-acetyltransferase [Erysipelotrichaceae bacterium]|jgi:aminoglycoside 3-N-acetyltransferase|nr:AAC(3) family N-acetyltransferase [Erysipelotrichaceae bacterium]
MIESLLTRSELVRQLKTLGIKEGMVVLVQARLSSFSYVLGGAQTVTDALLDCVGYDGTLIMPMFIKENSDPVTWSERVDHDVMETIRQQMPPYHPKESDSPWISEITENFRRRDGVIFSQHPSFAFAAWGKYAKLVCNGQSLHFPLSEESPLARIYELKGYVLLLGEDFDHCVMMHLGEYRSEIRPVILRGCSLKTSSGRRWRRYLDEDLDDSEFVKLGNYLNKRKLVLSKVIGGAPCHFFSAVHASDVTQQYFTALLNVI